MEKPTIEEAVEQLQAVSGAPSVDPDAAIQGIEDIDSLDLMEWLYGFQEQYPDIPADESLFDDIGDATTFRNIFEQIVGGTVSASSGS